MNILSLDTSGPVAGCAIMIDGKIAHLTEMDVGLTHSETAMPAVEIAMNSVNLTPKEIDLFAVVAGPGSFTGVRLGVCAIKGMAHAWNKKCVPINALTALSMNMAGFDGIVCPILDARRSQVYCAAYDVRNGHPVRVFEDNAIAIDEFIALLPKDKRLVFIGDGVSVNEPIIRSLGERAFIPPVNLRSIRADAVCELARNAESEWISAKELTPIYLRKPQAERERMKRIGDA